jgi:hypothetical protein
MPVVTGGDGTARPGYTTERVEIAPGRFIKMNESDKKAWLATQPQQGAPVSDAPTERATADAPENAAMPAAKPRKGR